MIDQQYKAQVDLLLQALPYVAKEESLALTGGTAINLFERSMPRLSVDIDLNYLPFDDRETALRRISECLNRIKKDMETGIRNISITPAAREGQDVKINCQIPGAHIKIEVNTVTSGKCWPTRTLQVNDTVENEFYKSAIINVVSHAELFGGKICAALDRQHPRDLFDVKLLFEQEGITEEIKQGFLVALISHNRPINEVVNPVFTDQHDAFNKQFSGMAAVTFSYDEFEKTREELVQKIKASLTENDKKFLIGFKKGDPDWNLLPIKDTAKLPAVKWKLHNIQQLKKENPEKHALMVKKLEDTLYRKTQK